MSDNTRESPDNPAESAPGSGEQQSPEPETTELERAQADAAKLKDMLVRTAADFDNFRKRTKRELDDARRSGRDDLLKELLPVFDNLERAIQSAQKATDVKAVSDGLGMIVKQFENTLGRAGITRVPTIGEMFDPSLHEAIQQLETNEHPPGTVVAEVQPGYVMGEKLVRAAMVVVAKPKSEGVEAS
jgi:molecular chaperone GrpE